LSAISTIMLAFFGSARLNSSNIDSDIKLTLAPMYAIAFVLNMSTEQGILRLPGFLLFLHIPDADDEDVETKSDEDEIYNYKICMFNEEDVKMKYVEVEESDKGEEKVTDAAKEELKRLRSR
ncbi:hypothetical protein Tco_1483527, partial [Tanacetum coccineum]